MVPVHLQNGGEVEVSGSPTEKAILSWGIQVNFSYFGISLVFVTYINIRF